MKKCLDGILEGDKCQCYYRGYKGDTVFQVAVARLVFVLVFEQIVGVLCWAIMKILPDIESRLAKRAQQKEKKRLDLFYNIGQTATKTE